MENPCKSSQLANNQNLYGNRCPITLYFRNAGVISMAATGYDWNVFSKENAASFLTASAAV
jgi:hypothetical protein